MSMALDTFEDAAAYLAQITERLEDTNSVGDVYAVADRLMLWCNLAGIALPGDPRWAAGQWWQRTDGAAENVAGWILCLRALADQPELCAAVVRYVAEQLATKVLTETPLASSGV